MSVESAIESLNSDTVTVFGTRRELRCPGGGQVTESACQPCKYKSAEWAERPAGQWIVDVSWPADDEAAHAAAMARLDHWRRYFDLEPRGGVEKAGKRYAPCSSSTGPKALVQEEPEITTVRFAVGGRESMQALIPAGQKDVEVEARTLGKVGSGALAEVEGGECSSRRWAAARTSSPPARARPGRAASQAREVRGEGPSPQGRRQRHPRRAPRAAAVRDRRGPARRQPGARGSQRHRPGLRGRAQTQAEKILPEWTAEGGNLEVLENGRNVRLRLEKGAAKARVELLDKASGAVATAEVRRKGP
jgi:hypothetical protein